MVNQYEDSVALQSLKESQATTFNIPLETFEENTSFLRQNNQPRATTKMNHPLKCLIQIVTDFIVICGGEFKVTSFSC
jgi:hypothetical protein